MPLDTLGAVLESMGFARMGPDEPMWEDELEVVPLLQLGLSSGTFDLAWLTRLGRAHAEGLRLLATSWTEAYQARFEGPALESGADQRTAMELAAQLGGDCLSLGDPVLLGIYRDEVFVRTPNSAPDGSQRPAQMQLRIAVGCDLLARRCSPLHSFTSSWPHAQRVTRKTALTPPASLYSLFRCAARLPGGSVVHLSR